MPDSNLKQALRPENAETVFNRQGTAPGIFWDVTKQVQQLGWSTSEGPRIIITFPGVPREMKSMWTEEVLPKLESRFPPSAVLVTPLSKVRRHRRICAG